ncbi:MAG: TonB-dependent receptor [Thermonemataceae bacterium]|nr:TonB-dependent receptor [Thermonemataceae bacterium]
MKKIIIFLILSMSNVFGQKIREKDSVETIDDVVITAQFEPQSIKKSLFNVRVISRKDIEQQAANNLADILNQYLNIQILPNSGTGRASVSMFGLDGGYFKILVDNVPLVSDNGQGNNIDLTQISLEDIEQIEIIEGSMGVTHGANAVGGILNIITKKTSKKDGEVSLKIQEETVGKEYALFAQGRHIQVLKASYNISDNWFVSMGVNRNDFRGFLDEKKGKDYAENDQLRGYMWLPRVQVMPNVLLNYSYKHLRVLYKADYLSEKITYTNSVVSIITNPPFDSYIFGKDKYYLTERLSQHLNASGRIKDMNYTLSLSFQKQNRIIENFEYNIRSQQSKNHWQEKTNGMQIWYSNGNLSNIKLAKNIGLQLGYEVSNNLGFALVDGENQMLVPIEKRLKSYEPYAVSELKVSKKTSLRAGFRYSFQPNFTNQNAYSLAFRYLPNAQWEWRAAIGKSFRMPTFEELYAKIKFSGHQFYGNENLIPEKSYSSELSLKRNVKTKAGLQLAQQLSASYLDIKDRIDMALVGVDAENNSPIYQYINISTYKMYNLSTIHQIAFSAWEAKAGLTWVGISRVIANGETFSDDRFLTNFQANFSLSHEWAKPQLLFSTYFKYNGIQQQFVGSIENGKNIFKLSEIQDYSFWDFTIRKQLLNKQLEFGMGVKNLLGITTVQQGQSSGAHNDSSSLLLAYGRSYFFKIAYNFSR